MDASNAERILQGRLSRLSAGADTSREGDWLVFELLDSREQHCLRERREGGRSRVALLGARVTREESREWASPDVGEARRSLLKAEVDERCHNRYSN